MYAHYETNCGRSQRLKEVWGDEVYDCYHDETHSCFVPGGIMIASAATDGMIATAIADGGNATDDASLPSGKILNSYGDVVVAESNAKSASDGENPPGVGRVILITVAAVAVVWSVLVCGIRCLQKMP